MNQNIDLNQFEKVFVDKVVFGIGKDHFVVGLLCGSEIKAFALGRTFGKEFFQNFQSVIEKSEQMFGKITVDSGISSSIQMDELKTDIGSDQNQSNQQNKTPDNPSQPKKRK